MKKHFLIIALFIFFSFILAVPQTRRIEAKKKWQEDSASSSSMNKPEVVFNVGHSDDIYSVAYSPDGKYVASGSLDNSIKIWEVDTARCIRTFTEMEGEITGGIYSLAYSPDGRYLASGCRLNVIKVWEVKTGKCMKTLVGHTHAVMSIAYSPDGKYVASGSRDKKIKLWEVNTGKCIRTFKGHITEVSSISYSPDGKYIASASRIDRIDPWDTNSIDDITNPYARDHYQNTVKIWEVGTGRCIKTLGEDRFLWDIYSIAYSPDGAYLACCAMYITIIYEVATGMDVMELEQGLNELNRYNKGCIVYSPDGKYVTGSFSSNMFSTWEVATGKCIKILEGHTGFVMSVDYSPDGKYLVTGSRDKTIKLWEVKTGEHIKTFGVYTNNVYTMIYSPDGKYLVSDSGNKIKIWDLIKGECIKTIGEYTYRVQSITYSPDGKYLAGTCLNDSNIKLWKLETGECIKTIGDYTESCGFIVYSPCCKCLASGFLNGVIKLWDVSSGRCIKTLEGHTEQIRSLCYSPDGKYLASASDDKTIKVWEIASGKCIKTLTGHTHVVDDVLYSFDGKYLVSHSYDDKIKLWEIASGSCIKTVDDMGHLVHASNTKNFQYASFNETNKTMILSEVVTGRCIRALDRSIDGFYTSIYSPDGTYLAAASWGGKIKFWNVGTGELLATTLNLKDGEWLTYTPEGFFAGSEWATKNLVHIVDGMRTVGIDQMFDSLYRPDLVAGKLRGEDISAYAKKVNFENLVRSGSAPITAFLNLDEEIANRDVAIEYSIQNTGGGIGEVNLILNGKNIRLAETVPSTSGQTLCFSHTVTLQNGKNTLELYAKNKAGKVESLRASKMLNWNGNVRKPNLYVLTVAVNKYRDRELQLKYAVPDAEAIIKGFESQKKSLYQNILTFNLFDGNVTKEGLKTSFQELSKKVEADDVFVFYIAGHGMTYEDGDYYYLPSDFRYTGSESIAKGGISKNDLTRFLSLIKAGKTLVLLDTCNSGSFLDSSARGLTEKTAIDRLTRSTGHATIAASTDRQSAMEGYEGHGIFTYILVEGLSGKADKDGDGFITLQELSAYAEEEVPRRSYEKWGYEQTPMRDLRKQDFPIYSK